jgi:AsmA protein
VVKVILVGTMAGQGGKALGELKGLTIPVRLSGPYTALKYKVEFSQMFSGKEQIEAGKELLKKSGEEKLRELGKGFLGGKESAAPSEKPGKAPAKKPEDEMKDRLKGLLGK